MAAPSTQPKNNLMGTITLADGTGTPVTLVIPFYRGDVQIGPLGEYLNERVTIVAMGLIIGLTWGAPRKPQITFSAWCGNIVGDDNSAPGAVFEFLTGTGAYSANIPTIGANRMMTVDITVKIEGTFWGDSADETVTVEDATVDTNFNTAAEGNVLAFSGEGNGAVVIDNDTNTVTLQQAA